MHNLKTLFRIGKRGVAAVVVGLFGLVTMSLANATPISFYDDPITPATERFTLGCGSASGDCSGLLEALVSETGNYDSTDPIYGGMFDLGNSGDATEQAFVNANTVGGDYFPGFGTKDESGNTTFTTSAEYLLIKIGNQTGLNTALVHNLSGGGLTLYFTEVATGSGLSHLTEFGTASVNVPEPSSLGLLGLGLIALGLIVWLPRKRGTHAG